MLHNYFYSVFISIYNYQLTMEIFLPLALKFLILVMVKYKNALAKLTSSFVVHRKAY